MAAQRTQGSRWRSFLRRGYWLGLLVAAPFLLFPSPLSTPALLSVPVLCAVIWLVRGEIFPRTPLNGILLLLFLMVLVSLWATHDMTLSLPKVSGVVLGLGVFAVVAWEGRRLKGWLLSMAAFLAAGLAIAGFSFLVTDWPGKIRFLPGYLTDLSPVFVRLPGAAAGVHPNEVAGALLWVAPSYLALMFFSWRNFGAVAMAYGRVIAWSLALLVHGAAVLVTIVLLLTQSRSAYFPLGVLLLALPVLSFSRRERWRFVAGVLLLLLFAAVVFTLVNGVDYWRYVRHEPALNTDTLPFRLQIWRRAIYAIQDFPLTGMGMNTFRSSVSVLYPLPGGQPGRDIGHAHNEFLQAALDVGVPGLVAFTALHLAAFWMLFDLWRRPRVATFPSRTGASALAMSATPAVALGLGGGLLGHMLYGLTDAVALGAKPGFLFWMLLGLISGLYHQLRIDKNMVRGGSTDVA